LAAFESNLWVEPNSGEGKKADSNKGIAHVKPALAGGLKLADNPQSYEVPTLGKTLKETEHRDCHLGGEL
jgi:hypothetical protein